MSKQRRRHRRSYRAVIAGVLKRKWAILATNPLKTCVVGALSFAVLWVILTKSLPYALAPTHPDVALALNPNNPAALLAKADEIRSRLVAFTHIGADKTQDPEREREEGANTLSRLPEVEADESAGDPAGEREILREEIHELATRELTVDPLEARAFRAFAESTAGIGEVRSLMQKAFEHSRRESIAAFWLLNDSYYHEDFKGAIRYADALLRTRPELGTYIYGYLALLAEAPEGRPLLVQRLAVEPTWRTQFFQVFPRISQNSDTPLYVMSALKEAGKPPSNKEVAPYLNFLIGNDRIDMAYSAWLRLLPADQLETVELLTNASFESKPSGLPFDWEIGSGTNAIADIVPLGKSSGALHIHFSDGRVRFPPIGQFLFLAPGRYRLEGKLRGTILGKRGLRWQIRCASGSQRILGETEILLGDSSQWRVFSLEAEVPQNADCHGEALRLIHDARSASEEFLTGEVWFSGLRLQRIAQESASWSPAP